jgi:hypothetical protein
VNYVSSVLPCLHDFVNIRFDKENYFEKESSMFEGFRNYFEKI